MTRDELINSREYWITKIQLDLFAQIEQYMADNKLSRTQLAEQLGVTKGYISQVLNGDFDHKISKLVDLSLAIGKIPTITYGELPTQPDVADSSDETRYIGQRAIGSHTPASKAS